MRCASILLILALLGSALTLTAQPIPVGCEFAVNNDPESQGFYPKAAYGFDGGFMVVYLDGIDGLLGSRVMARAFDESGNYLGPPIPVAEASEPVFDHPEIVRDQSGDFLVAWVRREYQSPIWLTGLLGRRLSSQGIAMGDVFEIDDVAEEAHSDVSLAAYGGGTLVAWSERIGLEDGRIKGRLVSMDGSVLGPELQLNGTASGSHVEPAVTTTVNEDFLVVWRHRDGEGQDIFGRRFDSTGTPLSGDLPIATSTTVDFDDPDVAANDDGFLVVWAQQEPLEDWKIFGRRLDRTAMPAADVAQIQGSSGLEFTEPSVGARANQDFVVAWNVFNDPGSGYPGDLRMEVRSRTMSPDGVLSGDFSVSSEMDGYGFGGLTFRPDVTSSAVDNELLVVWGNAWIRDAGHSGGSAFGQRFDGSGEPSRTDAALRFIESEDPSDGIGLTYWPEVRHLEACSVADFDLQIQVPQSLLDHGFSIVPREGATCQSGSTIQCSGTLRPGVTLPVALVADDLPNEAEILEISGSVELNEAETDLSNNSATETTQVVRCVELTGRRTGKGSVPQVDLDLTPSAPCSRDHFAGGAPVELMAAPAPDGWRIASWSGTDDDTSTSRRNVVTMPQEDHEVVAHYVFDQGLHWWTADGELDDLIGSNALMQIGAGDPFSDDGNQGQAFLLDGDPVLQTAGSVGLGQGNAFSLGFWLRVGASPEDERSILDQRQAGASADRGLYAFLDQGRPTLTLGDGSVSQTFMATKDLRDDVYHAVIYAFQGERLRIYIDGRLDSTHDTSQIGSFAVLTPATLGTASLGDPRPLHGLLDEVFIAAAALDPERIEDLFFRPQGQWRAEGNALDDTLLQRHGTLNEAAGYVEGQCGQGFDLSAPGATVTVPPVAGQLFQAGHFAFTAWVRAAEVGGLQDILDIDGSGARWQRLYLNEGVLTYRYGDNPKITASSLGDLRDGRPHFVGISSRDLGGGQVEVTLWRDDASLTTVQSEWLTALSDPARVFGGVGEGPIRLDEVMLFGRSLDAAAMQRLRTRSCNVGAFFSDGFESGDVSAWSQAVP